MKDDKELSQKKIGKLAVEISEIASHDTIFHKYSLKALEQVMHYYTTKRQALIERKETEPNGYEVEKINGELSAIKVETVKINKAIAEHKKKPQKKHVPLKVNDLPVAKDIVQTADQTHLIQAIKDCRTIPDITDKFSLDQVQYAKDYFKQLRQSTIDQHSANLDQLSANEYNVLLRTINNEISRTTKAVQELEQRRAKAKREEAKNEPVDLSKNFNYLRNFFNLACESLDEATVARLKQEAEQQLNERSQGAQNE
jgi:hypothetical protein